MTTLEKIKRYLTDSGIEFRSLHHQPTPTSEDAARVRGEPVEIGGKALVMKIDRAFYNFVLSGARRVDSKKIRRRLGARKARFATVDELKELTGLVPGSVPPFGEPILPLGLFVDVSIVENDRVAFNAGSLTDSIIMRTEEYLRGARPEVFDFSKS